MVGDSVFLARNLISSLPAIALAFAALLIALPRVVSAITITLVVAGLAFSNAASLRPDARRPAYADAASYVNDNARPGDVVLQLTPFVGPSTTALPLHLDPDIPYFKLHQPNGEDRALKTASANDGRIFYVRGDLGGDDQVPPQVASTYHPIYEHTWPGLYPITLIEYEPPNP
jgi:hypothetical protein